MTLHVKLLGGLLLIVAIGEAAAMAGHPFLYCQVWKPFLWRPFLQPYASLALMLCTAYFGWALLTAGLLSLKAFGAMGLMFLIGNLDGWARTILALGKGCE
jgi:hypothetical protein